MAVGGLVTVLCGLCTGVFEFISIAQWFNPAPPHADSLDFGPPFVPLLFGVVPILIGVGLFLWGRRMSRPRISGP